jgi:hypothetical protein
MSTDEYRDMIREFEGDVNIPITGRELKGFDIDKLRKEGFYGPESLMTKGWNPSEFTPEEQPDIYDAINALREGASQEEAEAILKRVVGL